MKKVIGIIAIVIICASAHFLLEHSDNISAEGSYSGDCGKNVTYEFDEMTGTLTISGDGPMYDYGIGNPSPWYSFRTSVKTVLIQESVTTIGDKAFYNCTSLTSVTIPNSMISIGNTAFEVCTSLTSVTIPDSVTSIGYGAFDSCTSLTSVTLSNSISSIVVGTFVGCTSLTSITIPNSVISIGTGAFESCTSLTSIKLGESVKTIAYRAFYNCTSLLSVTLSDSVSYLGFWAFANCTSMTTIYLGKSVESIDMEAFAYCSSLTSIGVDENNPTYCSIDGVLFNKEKTTLVKYPANKVGTAYTIPDSVSNIDAFAFTMCNSLTTISVPESLRLIGRSAFESCASLSSISLPYYLLMVGESSFNCCTSLKSVDLGNSVTYIGPMAFANCISLISITIPSSVTIIGPDAFSACTSLTDITVDEENTTYCSDDGVLFDKNKTTLIVYPENKSDISYIIPETVTMLTAHSFTHCINLVTLTIPNSVTYIGLDSFIYCDRLFEVINLSPLTNIHNGMYGFENVNNFFKSSSEATVKTDEHGFVYGKSEGIYYLITYIGDESEITIPSKIEESDYVIRNCAFYDMFYDTDGVTVLEPTTANLAGSTFKYIDGKWVKQTPTTDTFTIIFDANGGSGIMAAAMGISGEYTLPLCGFTAPEGKKFLGWAYSANGQVISGSVINVKSDLTLYAIWEKESSSLPVTLGLICGLVIAIIVGEVAIIHRR